MRIITFLAIIFLLSGCAQVQLASHIGKQAFPPSKSEGTFKVGTPYKVAGKRYYPKESYDLVETGIASWYGPGFHGKKTANGEIFDKYELTAAHKTLQMPSLVRVTNLENGRSLIVRVNDRGPYKRGRIIDLSERAASLLDFKSKGIAKVKLEVLRQESLQIAQAAKSGKSTNGYEVALNKGQALPGTSQPVQVASAAPVFSGISAGAAAPDPANVSREVLTTTPPHDNAYGGAIPGHTRGGHFYPEPVVTEMPVRRSDIFIQAGSFSVAENAYKLSEKLEKFAKTSVQSVTVSGSQFYRVRLGPVASIREADILLSDVITSGNSDAIIIID